MTSPLIQIIPETPGAGRLGRHIVHDPRSRSFEASTRRAALVSKTWTRHVLPFDQGDVGSCTGNAMAGVLATEPFFLAGRVIDESIALKLYELATQLDSIPGHYPPDDTGSSGLAVAKAAAKDKYIHAYHHAFGLNATLAAIGHVGPVIAGINWYEGFDQPAGSRAELEIAGTVRGGHEIEILGVDITSQLVRGCNSWGHSWGDKGYFTMSFATLDRLLSESGDIVVPVP